jgi:hypothetical protein
VQKPSKDVLTERPPPLGVVLEVARLAAVRSYGVLGRSLPELDEIARAAARFTGRQAGGVALLDEHRVWYVGAHELPAREAERSGSLCARTLAQTSPLWIGDLAADPCCSQHPDFGFRFYAGVSILDVDQYPVGALCVFDQASGEADPQNLHELSRLAELAAGLLALRREAHANGNHLVDSAERIQGWLGIRTRSSRMLRKNGRAGLRVLAVARGSPAERTGLNVADVLLSIDDSPLRHPADIAAALANRYPHSFAKLQILRAGHTFEQLVSIVPKPARRRPP